MKTLFYILIALAYTASTDAQTVGIGTPSPNANAILDIASTSKGVLIPRLTDTSNVTGPLEGMLIYNKNTKAPFFHDGNKWLSLGARVPITQPATGATITYQVVGPGFNGGELPVFSTQVGSGFGVSQPSPPGLSSASEFIFTKLLDINTPAFQQATLKSTLYPDIEFKFYATNASVPYISFRFQNVYFTGYALSSGGDLPAESVSVNYKNFGFKDWVNNVSYGYDVITHTATAY